MTPETAAFLLAVLDSITLSANAPDFEQTAQRIVTARSELEAIIQPPVPDDAVPDRTE